MPIRQSKTELAVWGVLALGAGLVPAWVDSTAADVQGPALLLMLVNFALTLPGRAPATLVAVATWVAMPLFHFVSTHELNPGIIIALIPAFLAAFGGKFAGRLLDTAASRLISPVNSPEVAWYDRPLTTRFLLSIALSLIAALGYSPLAGVLVVAESRVPADWLALVWQIMTLLGWIGVAPMILSMRSHIHGVRLVDLGVHLLLVAVLTVIHASLIVALSALLMIPLSPAGDFALLAFKIYLPLDLLVYITILTLGFLSDVERQRRDAEQREAALRSEAHESRLSALRARLNPHFLFNALNSVSVLGRAGRTNETGRLVEGLTGLLRYVLDERRTEVPLREELDFARQYLDVQQVRFGDRLTYDVAADPRVETVSVPQLLLQPIVENAVEHGVARSLAGGNVTVSAAADGDTLRLTIDDDGPGRATTGESTGESTGEADAGGAGSGIGLANTRERLRRLYGDRARLTLSPRSPNGGTRVVISLPLPPVSAA